MNLHRKALLMLCSPLTIVSLEIYWVDGASQVPCYFIFGDSLSDNGNNNNAYGTARADYKPYGIDFSNEMKPTGRFSNGRNVADFIAKFLGFDNYIPPFKNTTGWNILKGVIMHLEDQEFAMKLGEISSINEQLKKHNYTISKIHGLLGKDGASTTHLKSCLYTIQIGSNDYLNNYFMPLSYKTSTQFTPQQYAITLNKQLSGQLKTLYGQGARKVVVFGVGLIGCSPYVRANFDTTGSPCVDNINSAIQLFNIGLKSLVKDLNTDLTDAKFIFIDMFKISTIDPSILDQMVVDTPCCEVPPGGLQCTPFGKVCANRTQYIFWDEVHPTEIGFMSLASRAFHARDPNDTYPFDISHLARL